MSITNIINERVETNNGSDLDVFGKNQAIDVITNTVNERVENEDRLGSELATNGDFATNSDWTLETGWTINNSKLVGLSLIHI